MKGVPTAVSPCALGEPGDTWPQWTGLTEALLTCDVLLSFFLKMVINFPQ